MGGIPGAAPDRYRRRAGAGRLRTARDDDRDLPHPALPEQIAVDVALHRLPVILLGSGSGLAYAHLGPTHIATDDFALMRAVTGPDVLAAADAEEADALLRKLSTSAGRSTCGCRAAPSGRCRYRVRSPSVGHVLREPGRVVVIAAGCAHRDRAGRGRTPLPRKGSRPAWCTCTRWRRSTGPRSRPWRRRRTGRHAGGARAQRRARLGGPGGAATTRGYTPVPAVAPARGTGRVRRRLRTREEQLERYGLTAPGVAATVHEPPHARAGSTSPTSSARTSGSNGGSYPRMTPSAPDQ